MDNNKNRPESNEEMRKTYFENSSEIGIEYEMKIDDKDNKDNDIDKMNTQEVEEHFGIMMLMQNLQQR